MAFEDIALAKADDQFMFGPSILVAPFYGRGGWAREILLPPGRWYDFHTGAFVGSGGRLSFKSDSGRLPLLVREGAVIPMLKEPVTNTSRAYGQALEVRHYGAAPGSFDLFEDDGNTFDYERGQYRIRRLSVVAQPSGRLVLRETITRSGAEPMFGPAELRRMTR